MHKRYTSPSLLERGLQLPRSSSHAATSNLPGYNTSAIVAMDKSSVAPGESHSAGIHTLSQLKPLEKYSERSLESVLNSSKQKVSAIESLLRGVSISGKQSNSSAHSTSLDLGIKEFYLEHLLEFDGYLCFSNWEMWPFSVNCC